MPSVLFLWRRASALDAGVSLWHWRKTGSPWRHGDDSLSPVWQSQQASYSSTKTQGEIQPGLSPQNVLNKDRSSEQASARALRRRPPTSIAAHQRQAKMVVSAAQLWQAKTQGLHNRLMVEARQKAKECYCAQTKCYVPQSHRQRRPTTKQGRAKTKRPQ